jgi:hypothetical protein
MGRAPITRVYTIDNSFLCRNMIETDTCVYITDFVENTGQKRKWCHAQTLYKPLLTHSAMQWWLGAKIGDKYSQTKPTAVLLVAKLHRVVTFLKTERRSNSWLLFVFLSLYGVILKIGDKKKDSVTNGGLICERYKNKSASRLVENLGNVIGWPSSEFLLSTCRVKIQKHIFFTRIYNSIFYNVSSKYKHKNTLIAFVQQIRYERQRKESSMALGLPIRWWIIVDFTFAITYMIITENV